MFELVPWRRENKGVQLTPYEGLRGMFDLMDNFFDTALMPDFTTYRGIKADVKETEKEFLVEADIPGARKEDIRLAYEDNTLTIAVEQREEKEEKGETFLRKERRYGSSSRSFYLEGVKNEEISAKYDNGVLKIALPKEAPELRKAKNIEIE